MPTLSRRVVVKVLVAGGVLLLVIAILASQAGSKPAKTNSQKQTKVAKQDSSAPKPEAPAYTFPKGDRQLLPNYRFVALYGTPGVSKMGVLGEQPVDAATQRVKEMAAQYQPHSSEPIWPTFEIISSIASASPTANGDYSRELSVEELQPWVAAAKDAGVYVVLDLQPGRTDFLTQAKLYEPLLKEPHVGLALDPEWRLKPDQVHMEQIGSVDAAEVNNVSAWLADVTKANGLPQKMFLLHQFRMSMIANREQLVTSRTELAYVIQMDGNGGQPTKLNTWQSIQAQAPANVYFGWKNFYDEDKPMLSPDATMLLTPKPWYVSYQ